MLDEQNAEPMDETAWRKFVCDRFREGNSRMDGMEAGINANTDAVTAVKTDTQELLEIFKAVKGGFKVLGWFGAGAKWVGVVAAAGTAIVAAYQFIAKLFSK